MSEIREYPDGDGLPDCSKCFGRGVIPIEIGGPSGVMEATEVCRCVMLREVRRNVDRGWPGLMDSDSHPTDTSLKKYLGENLWVTSSEFTFRQHFKRIAVRSGPKWGFLVRSDAELMSAWLSTAKTVHDAEVDQMRLGDLPDRYIDMELLVIPPTLLVILLGVKTARNAAMPEVLTEAIRLRMYQQKPTWIVDHPGQPFCEGHISWSRTADETVSSWPHVRLRETKVERVPEIAEPEPETVSRPADAPRPTVTAPEPPDESEDAEAVEPDLGPSPNTNKTTNLLSLEDATPVEKPYWQQKKKKGGRA